MRTAKFSRLFRAQNWRILPPWGYLKLFLWVFGRFLEPKTPKNARSLRSLAAPELFFFKIFRNEFLGKIPLGKSNSKFRDLYQEFVPGNHWLSLAAGLSAGLYLPARREVESFLGPKFAQNHAPGVGLDRGPVPLCENQPFLSRFWKFKISGNLKFGFSEIWPIAACQQQRVCDGQSFGLLALERL